MSYFSNFSALLKTVNYDSVNDPKTTLIAVRDFLELSFLNYHCKNGKVIKFKSVNSEIDFLTLLYSFK